MKHLVIVIIWEFFLRVLIPGVLWWQFFWFTISRYWNIYKFWRRFTSFQLAIFVCARDLVFFEYEEIKWGIRVFSLLVFKMCYFFLTSLLFSIQKKLFWRQKKLNLMRILKTFYNEQTKLRNIPNGYYHVWKVTYNQIQVIKLTVYVNL